MAKKQQASPVTTNKDATKQDRSKKMTILESTQMWSPVKDVLDGIVITKDGRYVQIMEFAPINFLLRPLEEQYAIANVFGSAIRIFPKKFQIKVLSRRANVESHLLDIQHYMKEESNEQCRRMQQETINLIRSNAGNGVSKRFLLSFEYNNPPGLRKASWPEIRASLAQKAGQIAGVLESEPCGNELLSPIGDTDHTLDILYDCMNRAEAELKSFDTKINDVVCTYLIEKRLTDEKTNIPPNEFIAPQAIDPSNSKYVVVDGKYHAYGYIPKRAYPLTCYPGWLSLLVNMGEGVDVDIWVEKVPTEKIRQSLTRSMNWTQAELKGKDDSAADLDALNNKISAARYFRAGLGNEQEFMYFSVMLSIIASSEEELKKKITWVQTTLLRNELKLVMLNFRHNEAFLASLPLCNPDPNIFRQGARNLLSGDFGAAYPFTSYEINDRGGVLLGINQANYSPVFINQFDQSLYNNGNMAIFGTSGSGKTYLLQCLALRLRQQQVQTVIIAPYKGHEFRRACQEVGGQFISLAPGSPHNINIMEIRKYDTTNQELLDGSDALKGSILAAKIQQLRAFFFLLLNDITPVELHALDESINRTYERFGITHRNKSLIDPSNPTQYKRMPILQDLFAELSKRKDAHRVTSVLARFVDGSAKSFNAQTNVDLNNPYVVIDVSSMSKELLPIGIFIATDFVTDAIKVDRTKKKAIIWDELSRLIGMAGSDEAAEFVLSCFKTYRAYRAICIAATQDTNDFLALKDGMYGKGILANSKIKIIMKVEAMEAAALSSIADISPIEAQRIQYFKRGEALLIANRNHAEVKITASPLEDSMITTDPAQLEKQLYLIKKERSK